MSIYLGNLSVAEIEQRLGVEFTQEIPDFLSETRQTVCSSVGKEQWHCYDIPFMFQCGSRDFAQKVYDMIKPYHAQCKVPMQIGVKEA